MVKRNTVALGDVRITVRSPVMLRAEWVKGGAFEDRPSVTLVGGAAGALADQVLVVRCAALPYTAALNVTVVLSYCGCCCSLRRYTFVCSAMPTATVPRTPTAIPSFEQQICI